MARYYISFAATVSTGRIIEADSEEQAIELAQEALNDDSFCNGIIEDMNQDYCAYGDIDTEFICKYDDTLEADWPVEA